MSGPDRANFIGSPVTQREDVMNRWRIRFCELVPTLTAKALRSDVGARELAYRLRMDMTRWVAPRTVSSEVWETLLIQNRLGHYRPSGIARAQKEHIEAPRFRRHSILR